MVVIVFVKNKKRKIRHWPKLVQLMLMVSVEDAITVQFLSSFAVVSAYCHQYNTLMGWMPTWPWPHQPTGTRRRPLNSCRRVFRQQLTGAAWDHPPQIDLKACDRRPVPASTCAPSARIRNPSFNSDARSADQAHPNRSEPPLWKTTSYAYLTDSAMPDFTTRREALQSLWGGTLALTGWTLVTPQPSFGADIVSAAAKTSALDPLETWSLGQGQWVPLPTFPPPLFSSTNSASPPAPFCTYAARFLLTYDAGVATWWRNSVQKKVARLSSAQQQDEYRRAFGSLACTIERAVGDYIASPSWPSSTDPRRRVNDPAARYGQFMQALLDRYGTQPDAPRQIALLMALLPPLEQPVAELQELVDSIPPLRPDPSSNDDDYYYYDTKKMAGTLRQDWTALLPDSYAAIPVYQHHGLFSTTNRSLTTEKEPPNLAYYTVEPPVPLDESILAVDPSFDSETGPRPSTPRALTTVFGPLAGTPLMRETLVYGWPTYALLGLAGASGCALTHALVIPLDVLKTRAQTDPTSKRPSQTNQVVSSKANLWETAVNIWQTEGLAGLLLGSQATLAGYFWYGLSVYPSYTFFKRFLSLQVLPVDVATALAGAIALVAGALAAVVASLGLTPLEAARIRVVADPQTYRPLGLAGTLQVMATEDPSLGWKTWYAGLPSLLTRQVVFGSVKFLAFERACDAIFDAWPLLREATWTSLTVSLVAGGCAGTLSSIVSHPADAVLTYVAQNSRGDRPPLGVWEGSRLMMEKEGISSLFRGLGSRCVWAGSIIAGQFLLYDIIRTYFGVNTENLSEVFQVVLPQA